MYRGQTLSRLHSPLFSHHFYLLLSLLESLLVSLTRQFRDSLSRSQNQDELEGLIGEWTRNYTPGEATEILQEAGVPSGPSVSIKELVEDPHLAERGYFVVTEHPVAGKVTLEGIPWKSSVSQPDFRHAPLLGQDNYYVFHDLLGMSDEEFARLVDQRIIN